MKKIKFKLTIIFISLCFNLNAQENLDSLLKMAAKNNPSLKSKFYKYQADLQKAPQVGSLADPDLTIGYYIEPMELVSGKQRAQIQFMQMFPWFGTLKAAKDEASAMALSSFELFRTEKEEIFYNVRINYFQLFLTNKQIKIYDTTMVLLKSIEELLLSKIKSVNSSSTNPTSSGGTTLKNNTGQNSGGMGMSGGNQQSNQQSNSSMNSSSMSAGSSSSFSDLLRLQVEIKELDDNIATLKDRKNRLTIQLNELLNRNPSNEIFLPDSLSIPLFDFYNPALFDSIKVNNPMIKMNKADILAYQKRQLMNKKMSYPMIGLGLSYSIIDKSDMSTSPMNGQDMIMPMLTVKLPIYRKKYNASVKEAAILEMSASEQLKNSENMLYATYSENIFALKDAERKLKLYKDIISLTQKSIDVLIVQYASSGAEFDSLIRLYKQLLDYKLNIMQAQTDKISSIAGLQKLISKN